ncbi:MAG: GNAT family N-acetyltransferase, partial [Eggerthellaceae bacterium]|nr:GNAT family N-acetyltransferase [Eggerthellaceae bacterium]
MAQASYRFATQDDVSVILDLIKQLAEYEKAADQVVATEELLHESLFEQRAAEVLLVEADGRAVGFAVFFTSYSTWLARAGIFLEDLFVLPDERGKSYGKGLLTRLAQIAVERGCGRLEWNCLDWNQPSIDF